MSSSADVRALSFASADDSEEIARAEVYGLLARLWIAAPDAELLGQFGVAVTEAPQPGGHLEAPWQSLVAAMRATTPEAAAEEYDALFGGVGKPEVFLYGSYYLSGFLNEKPLATLRSDLATLGLTRAARRNRRPHRLPVRGDALADCRRRRCAVQPRAAAQVLPRAPAVLGRQAR
jgi:TorA maturation chaperone TorD